MLSLQIVILHHTTGQGSHYDWLMEEPPSSKQTSKQTSADSQSLLWAARVDQPPWLWRGDRKQTLTPLVPHRRRYLHYQGPISAGRGSVKRVARGLFHPICWTPGLLRLQIHWQSPAHCVPMLAEVTTTAQWSGFVANASPPGIIAPPAL